MVLTPCFAVNRTFVVTSLFQHCSLFCCQCRETGAVKSLFPRYWHDSRRLFVPVLFTLCFSVNAFALVLLALCLTVISTVFAKYFTVNF